MILRLLFWTVAVSAVGWTSAASEPAPATDEPACARHQGDACARIARIAADAHDMPRYRTFIDKACAAKHGPSCELRAQLATTTGEAAAFHKRGCELGHQPSCGDYGQMLVFGNGVEKAEKAGIKILEKACQANEGRACSTLVNFTKGPRKLVLAVKACELGGGFGSCFLAGDAYLKGDGVKADPVRAKQLFARACTPLVPSACHKAGIPVPPATPSKP